MKSLTASDLRVGNYIVDYEADPDNTIYWQIEEILKNGVSYRNGSCFRNFDSIQPIPLTKTIALSLGFKTRTRDSWVEKKINNYAFYYNHIDDVLQIERDSELYNGVAYYSKGDNHLHDLQNLVKDLTNTELTLKEDKK